MKNTQEKDEGTNKIISFFRSILEFFLEPVTSFIADCRSLTWDKVFKDLKKRMKEIFVLKNVLLITMMILQAFQLVFQKIIASRLGNYPYELTVMQSTIVAASFAVLALLNLIGGHIVYGKKTYLTGNPPGWQPLPLPEYEFPEAKGLLGMGKHLYVRSKQLSVFLLTNIHFFYIVTGCCFTLSNFLYYTGARGNYVSGDLVVLFKQFVVPVTMIFSYIFLGTRFRLTHYLGALVILAGILLALGNNFHTDSSNSKVALGLLFLGGVPLSLAVVYFEYALKYRDLDPFVMWTWVNVWEIVFALPLVLVILPIQGIPASMWGQNIANFFSCFFGQKVVVPTDNLCPDSAYWYIGFWLFLISVKVNQAYLIKWNSGSLMWISATCAVPIANLLFTSPYFLHQPFTDYTIGGLILVDRKSVV